MPISLRTSMSCFTVSYPPMVAVPFVGLDKVESMRSVVLLQTLYILFQAYAPEKSNLNSLRAGLALFRDGRRVNQTPLVEPTQVNEANHTVSFRMSVPLSSVGSGRYTVQAVVVEAGGEQAGFARSYFALRPATASSGTAAPASGN